MQYYPYVRRARVELPCGAAAGRYPFNIPAVRALDGCDFHPAVTFFVGENGTGKSTLIEALAVACGFCPEGGSRHFRLETCATHSPLWQALRLEKGPLPPQDGYFLRAESFYNVASYIDELDREPAAAPPIRLAYGGESLHEQSHGESFFALLRNRLHGKGLYIFDEPEAALSPQRQMAMLVRMRELAHQHSQFIIATHSPILLAYPDCCIYELSEQGMRETAYRDTAHYQLTRWFLNQPERAVQQLLQEEETPPPSDE